MSEAHKGKPNPWRLKTELAGDKIMNTLKSIGILAMVIIIVIIRGFFRLCGKEIIRYDEPGIDIPFEDGVLNK